MFSRSEFRRTREFSRVKGNYLNGIRGPLAEKWAGILLYPVHLRLNPLGLGERFTPSLCNYVRKGRGLRTAMSRVPTFF